ncbi:hypothetical protein [Marivirga arenosa]|uniref:Uncharacterized protein n=1 Tax=Marivirga arenosa TaxID=3059076 RepID=A0AA49GJ29_9BACT|nr:hypothetical protein [Marivirga sp. BKB1-2]WKK81095.1 hypothetical protein QYS47_01510 [Marivirga sp. BKB1-2]
MGYIIAWVILALLVGAIGSNRKIGFGMALLWSILLSPLVGLIITLFSESESKSKKIPNYKKHKELGAKAEYKNENEKAIDHYMDALYHLENDYKNKKISKTQNEKRLQHIEELKKKVSELKGE